MKCEHCSFDLDGGDVYEVLRKMKEYRGTTDEEVMSVARMYGYTEENRKHFSKAVIQQYDDKQQETICCHCRKKLAI
jgi:hypothetical protein